MNYEPYALFLNGEYWGFYYLTEKYDVQYIENYYGVDKGTEIDDIIIMKNGVVETGVEADFYVSYKEMREFILGNDMSDDANYQKLHDIIDIQSFIDYYAVECYIGRCRDWPSSNTAMWRSRYTSEKPYEDGKWRWMLFDVNSTVMVDIDSIAYVREHSDLFGSLWNNQEFRTAFSERLIQLSDTIFSPEIVDEKLSEYVSLMDDPMENHYQRFFGTSNERFYEEVDKIREFFNNRRETVLESIDNNMK